MKPHQIIDSLRVYNDYRRGGRDYADMELSPTEIGKAIDAAIRYIEEAESERRADGDDWK